MSLIKFIVSNERDKPLDLLTMNFITSKIVATLEIRIVATHDIELVAKHDISITQSG